MFSQVTKESFIDVDLENEDLLITTNSFKNDNDRIEFRIFDETNAIHIAAFWIIYEDSTYKFHIGKCTKEQQHDFFKSNPPTASTEELTWKISEKPGRLEIYCNNVKSLNFEFVDGFQSNTCVAQWNLDAARIKFFDADTASKSYAISPRPVPRKYDHDVLHFRILSYTASKISGSILEAPFKPRLPTFLILNTQ